MNKNIKTVILFVVLYGRDRSYLTLRKEHNVDLGFENRVLI